MSSYVEIGPERLERPDIDHMAVSKDPVLHGILALHLA